ncbi:hypothetical protein COV20_03065 [Candidatus Woesearchaeota archaeon CG10_big_fil_rev_8_21_14_0_10_45_16]|nr:MAG: hypothetical protein COV20_03065 [Candidatus Woesearchaeota archaeon CG10_big_fil_rev_8_21_14_0_10_45_16]
MASYQQLQDFQEILEDYNFTLISSSKSIERMRAVIRNLPFTTPPGTLQFAEGYLAEFQGFIKTINYSTISELKEGITICIKTVSFVLSAIKQGKNTQIPRGKCRTMEAEFLFGLNKIVEGLKLGFRTRIKELSPSKQDTLNYIYADEGLRRKYIFNSIGVDSPIRVLPSLSVSNLYTFVQLLELEKDVKRAGKWKVYGTGMAPLRVVVSSSMLGKKRVYAVFKTEGHDKPKGNYMTLTINRTPSGVEFQEG